MPTDDPTAADDPFDRNTFETELAALIDRARENEVHLDGAYDVRTPQPGGADYTVEISRIANRALGTDRGSGAAPD